MTLRNGDQPLGALTRMLSTHCFHDVFSETAQSCGAEARTDAKNLDTIFLELVVPVQHQHAHGRLAAAISNCLEADLLGPACWLWRRREVGLGCLGHLRQAGKEEDAGVCGLEQQGDECPGYHVGARDVDIIGSVEALSQRCLALQKLTVETGASET